MLAEMKHRKSQLFNYLRDICSDAYDPTDTAEYISFTLENIIHKFQGIIYYSFCGELLNRCSIVASSKISIV